MADIQKYSEQTFESIKHINEYGQEFWYARELQTALEYTEWRNFKKIIDKAKDACATSGNPVGEHFVEVNKSSPMPNGGVREVEDFMLSRYACYLIVMNGDPRKEVIAVGQTYFAIKTRQQELVENYDELTENQKRIAIRHEMAEHNKSLAEAAQMAGVETSLDYATFQNYGYMGLYGGLRAADIKVRKGLKKSQNILDHMGSTEPVTSAPIAVDIRVLFSSFMVNPFCALTGHVQNQHRGGAVGGSTVHIRQQHVIDHLQDMQRDAFPMLQGRFNTGDILRAGCIIVVRIPAAWAAVRLFHGFTFFPVRL